jgi:glycosyltransferase involved in cell wall biosynthesis
MKVIILNTEDTNGGAARAAYRLHRGLQKLDTKSQMMVQIKTSNDDTVARVERPLERSLARARSAIDRLPLRLAGQECKSMFSTQWLPNSSVNYINRLNPDIINFHWINGGYIPIESLSKFLAPLVWTLHDMWAFTGGCHYSGDCDRFTQSCGMCPALNSSNESDVSRWVWQRKRKNWQNINLTIVTPSHWLAKQAKSSSLFQNLRIEVIPNGIDTEVYQPIDRSVARKILGLPPDKYLILFGALNALSDPIKGFDLLLSALKSLKESQIASEIEVAIVGSSKPDCDNIDTFKTHYLNKLHDDISLSLVYSAADVFICPSRNENLPNVILESLSCGTPCVAFNIGGIPDLIDDRVNGYLAMPFDTADMARGIEWILTDPARYSVMRNQARQKAIDGFNERKQATSYRSLFDELLLKKPQ